MTINNKRILKRSIILTIIILIILYFLNSYVIYGIPNFRFNIINKTKSTPNIDILIMGNSHIEDGINASLISDMTSKTTYNVAFPVQESAELYYFLEEIFQEQHPKIIVLGAYSMIRPVEGAHNIMPFSLRKIKYYSMLDGEVSFKDMFFPIARLHNCWAHSNLIGVMKKNLSTGEYNFEQFFSTKIMTPTAVKKHQEFDSKKNAKVLKKVALDNLIKIKELCDKNDTKLVLTMIPWYKTLVAKLDYKELYYNPISKVCKENDIPYFDMNIDSDVDWNYTLFNEQDYTYNTHVNAYGQHYATCELAYYLDTIYSDLTVNKEYPKLMTLKEYLSTISKENDLLIIDDCPNLINLDVLVSAEEELSRLNITLPQEKSTDSEIIYISSSAQYDSYKDIDDIDYQKQSVTIYELDCNTGDVISHAVIRWDEFDTLFIR